jgi:ArsR family transcriptional regulator, arsenate/arsenite/antimonite-responsive transcriptional repressor
MSPKNTFVKANMKLESLFAALADRTRLRLLNLMSAGEVCVCYFIEVLDEPQPKISRHLAFLRNAGLVSARRDGKWMHYSIATPQHPLLQKVLDALRRDPEMQRDAAGLTKACCSPHADLLKRAPKPEFAR